MTWATNGEPDAVHMPIKKRPQVDRRDVERQLNRGCARIRVGAEWGAGHLKNWGDLSTRYRAYLAHIEVISAMMARGMG